MPPGLEREMIDLHCHLLPSVDDGAADLAMALDMARRQVAGGVSVVACTPHILPGLYPNTGPAIRAAVDDLRVRLAEADIPLTIVTGADVHIEPDIVEALQDGRSLTIADTRYMLIEPPHHVRPPRFDGILHDLMVAGYVPIVTHPERLSWVEDHYDLFVELAASGVWMQITSGSLTGFFGSACKRLAERMLDDGIVHILASDAHDTRRRVPDLWRGAAAAARRVGEAEARRLVLERPQAVLLDRDPAEAPAPEPLRLAQPPSPGDRSHHPNHGNRTYARSANGRPQAGDLREDRDRAPLRGMVDRMRRYFS